MRCTAGVVSGVLYCCISREGCWSVRVAMGEVYSRRCLWCAVLLYF